MKRRAPPKLLGERAECAFLNEAIQRGFTVSKPFGDSAPYDFIVHANPFARCNRLWKVQVKSTSYADRNGGYFVRTGHLHGSSRRGFLPHEADFFAAYIVPLKAWYLIPVRETAGRKQLRLFPNGRKRCRGWERYREAWPALRATRLPPLPKQRLLRLPAGEGPPRRQWRDRGLEGVRLAKRAAIGELGSGPRGASAKALLR